MRDPALFRFWAYRIVQRRSADYIRLQQKEREATKVLKIEFVEAEEDGASPDSVEIMLRAIKELPPMQQEMLRLFYLDKYAIREIAQMINLPEGTVKSRLFHSRQLLKNKLKEVSHE